MPRYSRKRSSNFGNSVWQQKGTSLSLKNALLEYNVTEKQLIDAKIPLQWRSCYGNSFPVFQRADVERVVRMNSGGLSFEISQATTQLNNKRKELDVAKASVQSLTCEVDALAHKIEDLKRRDAEAKQQAAAEAAGTQAQEEQTPEKAAEDVPQGYAPVAQEQRREPFNSVAAFLHNQLPVTYSAPQEGPDQKKVKIIAI